MNGYFDDASMFLISRAMQFVVLQTHIQLDCFFRSAKQLEGTKYSRRPGIFLLLRRNIKVEYALSLKEIRQNRSEVFNNDALKTETLNRI